MSQSQTDLFGEREWEIMFEAGPLGSFFGTHSDAVAYATQHFPGFVELREVLTPKVPE